MKKGQYCSFVVFVSLGKISKKKGNIVFFFFLWFLQGWDLMKKEKNYRSPTRRKTFRDHH